MKKTMRQLTPDYLALPLASATHVGHLTAREAKMPLFLVDRPFRFFEDLPYVSDLGTTEQISVLTPKINPDFKLSFTKRSQDSSSSRNSKCQSVLCHDSRIKDNVSHHIACFFNWYAARERLWASSAWRLSTLPNSDTNSGSALS